MTTVAIFRYSKSTLIANRRCDASSSLIGLAVKGRRREKEEGDEGKEKMRGKEGKGHNVPLLGC